VSSASVFAGFAGLEFASAEIAGASVVNINALRRAVTLLVASVTLK
jgi:hypothetical protein